MAIYRLPDGRVLRSPMGILRSPTAALPRPDDAEVTIEYQESDDGFSGHVLTVIAGLPDGAASMVVRADGGGFEDSPGAEDSAAGSMRLRPSSVAREIFVCVGFRDSAGRRGPMSIFSRWARPPKVDVPTVPVYILPVRLTAALITSRLRVVATSGGWYTAEITAQPGDPHYDAVEFRWYQASGNANPPQPAESSTGPLERRPDEGSTRVWRFAVPAFSAPEHAHERQAGGIWATCNLLYKTGQGVDSATGQPIISSLGPISESFSWAAPAPVGVAPQIVSNAISATDPRVGDVLTSAATFTGDPTPAIARTWSRNGELISGATGATLATTTGYVAGDVIRCTVTATNTHGSVSSTSAPVTLAAVAPVPPPAALVADWAIVGETGIIADGKKTLWLCTTAAGAYSADVDMMWWTNWTSQEQVYPFECVQDGTVPSGPHAGRKRWRMTGVTHGGATDLHLRGAAGAMPNIGIMVRLTPEGLRSAFPAVGATARRGYTFEGVIVDPGSDLPNPNVTVNTNAELLAALNAAPTNAGTYRIGVQPGSYGGLVLPDNFSKSGTRVVVQAASSFDGNNFPTFSAMRARGARNLTIERARIVGTSFDGFGFPSGNTLGRGGGMEFAGSKGCTLKNLYIADQFYGIDVCSGASIGTTEDLLVDLVTIQGFANDAIRLYSEPNNIPNGLTFQRFWVKALYEKNVSPDTGVLWGTGSNAYRSDRRARIDGRRNDQDGGRIYSKKPGDTDYSPNWFGSRSYRNIGYFVAGTASATKAGNESIRIGNTTIPRATQAGRHCDGGQANGNIRNVLFDNFRIDGWNGYMHGLLIHNEPYYGPNINPGPVTVRRGFIQVASNHGIQVSRQAHNAVVIEQCIIRPFPGANWATEAPGWAAGPGNLRTGISLMNMGSNKVIVRNTVQPANPSGNWNAAAVTATNLVHSDTAVPVGWADTLVAQGLIGFRGAAA